MDDLVKTARRAKGSDLLPKVSFGTMNAETLILRMADRIEELKAAVAAEREACAELLGHLFPLGSDDDIACDVAAEAIRARGKTDALAEQEKDNND